MAGDTVITIIGNLTADPELRFTASGVAVAAFTIASTPRVFDRQAGQWQEGQALFMRCTVWRDVADHVAESLRKGMRVIAQGRLAQRSYTDRQGVSRTVVEMQVDEVGPSLRYAKAEVQRADRAQAGGHTAATQGYRSPDASQAWGQPPTQPGAGGQPQAQQQSSGSYQAPPGGTPDDPWATAGATSFGDEPPLLDPERTHP
ncbi:single-stranded DNA-binding protein [Actinomyces faecalis]|uniref:single-stranded DNA-binding protein n=1 Tax=Actinomyces faecalis TaxID=2722820 RepID=UPI0015533A97|nr:single-stranded DNA-binding protein [Actinomyces faecalis]